MSKVGRKPNELETAIFERLTVSLVLEQGKRQIRFAKFGRSQTCGKVVARYADNCMSKQSSPLNLVSAIAG